MNEQIETKEDQTRISDLRENAIEWYSGEQRVTVSISQERVKNYLKQCAAESPGEVKVIKENDNGVLYAHIPLSYVRIRRPRKLTDEQREAAAERLRNARNAKNQQNS